MVGRHRPKGTEGVEWDREDYQPDLLPEHKDILERYITEARETRDFAWRFDPRSVPAGLEALNLERTDQAALVVYLGTAFTRNTDADYYLQRLQAALMRRKLPFSDEMLTTLARPYHRRAPHRDKGIPSMPPHPPKALLTLWRTRSEASPLTGDLRDALEQILVGPIRDIVDRRLGGIGGARAKALRHIEKTLGIVGDQSLAIEPGVAWRDVLLETVHSTERPSQALWAHLLSHCSSATSSRPTKKWLTVAGSSVDELGAEAVNGVLARVLAAVLSASSPPTPRWEIEHMTAEEREQLDFHQIVLRGLVWLASIRPDATTINEVGSLAQRCYKKIRWHGPADPKTGNACVWTLAHCGQMEAVAHLTELTRVVTHKSTRTQLGRALEDAAETFGLTTEEIEELATPRTGMTAIGQAETVMGEHTAITTVGTTGGVTLAWRRPDGKVLKGAPKQLRESHPEEIKDVRAASKRLKETTAGVRHRLERMLMMDRSWRFDAWRERYPDHPVVGPMARSLIWSIDGSEAALWPAGHPIGADGRDLPMPTDDATIRLWHPVHSSSTEISAWRRLLDDLELTQPVKQAHRETYVLTDAELATGTYSNRFAGHIVRQHQMRALCQASGWEFNLIGSGFDSHNYPTLELPREGLTVSFSVDTVTEDIADLTSIYLYLGTDFVDFRDDSGARVHLSDIRPAVFSEIMRDVDLFVSVASVGSDPMWSDGGPEGQFRDYWLQFAEGALNPSAEARRDVLEGLIPRLGRAKTWSIDGRHLIVQGKLHAYRIHLGSGNVMMEPSRYLCIVPDGSGQKATRGRVWLPFEGDRMLSVILSKALMLSRDDKITDPTILSQLEA